MTVDVRHGDCMSVLPTLAENSIDSVVCDPPYGLEFMGKDWDKFAPKDRKNSSVWDGRRQAQNGWEESAAKRSGKGGGGPSYRSQHKGSKRCTICGRRAFSGSPCECPEPQWVIEHRQEAPSTMLAFQAYMTDWAREVYRVLKPGAHLIAFSGTRTYHRMACAIEDAGFEIRDQIMYLYGSGFPKAHNLKNKPEIFCQCGGDAVPYDHGKEISEHNLRSVRQADLSEAVNAGNERGQVLFAGLSEPSASERGASRSQSESGGREQPGMEGWPLHRAGQGLCDDPQTGTSEGTSERLCSGTHPSRGGDARPSSYRNGGSPPQGFEPGEQRSGEPQGVCEPSGALDGRALPHGGCCPRCGKLTEAFKAFSTALKPAVEPICLARKPLGEKTVAANVLRHGTGAINVDGCRVPSGPDHAEKCASVVGLDSNRNGTCYGEWAGERTDSHSPLGRWPANVITDGSEEVIAAFPESDQATGRPNCVGRVYEDERQIYGSSAPRAFSGTYLDTGSAARFFYTAKADADDRLGSKHPTVKPVDLMAYLCRLVTPPGGTVLDPFAGSGTTGMACMREGFDCVLIEREEEYVADIHKRLAHVHGTDTPLFDDWQAKDSQANYELALQEMRNR